MELTDWLPVEVELLLIGLTKISLTKSGFVIESPLRLRAHFNENSIYVFPEKELRGLSPNFHIHVSVSDLYIPRISPHISCSRIGRPIVGIYKSLTDT